MSTKKNLYHVVLIFGGNTPDSMRSNCVDQSKSVFNDFAMEIVNEESTGITKFAYKIGKYNDGFYYILSLRFKNPDTSIRDKILQNTSKEIHKRCGSYLLRYSCFTNRSLTRSLIDLPNV
jgi:ribosomal protein S6